MPASSSPHPSPRQPLGPLILLEVRWDAPPRLLSGPPGFTCHADDLEYAPRPREWPLVQWREDTRSTVARAGAFGAHPLYVAEVETGVLLGSSALLVARASGLPRAIDPVAALWQLGGELLPGTRSLFSGIRQVPPGTEVRIVPSSRRWSIRPSPQRDSPRRDASDLENALARAVRRSLAPEGTLVTLSGGLDSSLLLSFAAASGMPLHAVSLDDGHEPQEVEVARSLAGQWGVPHSVYELGWQEVAGTFASAVKACESLLWNARAVAKHLLYAKAADIGWTRLLSGVGADEVFWGNPSWAATVSDQGNAIASRLHDDRRHLARIWSRDSRLGRSGGNQGPGTHPDQIRAWLLRCVLPFSTLPPECRSAARLGLDVRLPYLDEEVVGIGLAIPWHELARGDEGKLPLRKLASTRLPPSISHARKAPVLAHVGEARSKTRLGWSAEVRRWIERDGFLQKMSLDREEAARWLDRFDLASASELRTLDRLLMRLASLSVLDDELGRDHDGPGHAPA